MQIERVNQVETRIDWNIWSTVASRSRLSAQYCVSLFNLWINGYLSNEEVSSVLYVRMVILLIIIVIDFSVPLITRSLLLCKIKVVDSTYSNTFVALIERIRVFGVIRFTDTYLNVSIT